MEKPSVLVVDDDPGVLMVCAMALRTDGYPVTEATGGGDALGKLGAAEFDIVLTDLMMPEPDGIALLREIKARWPATDVVIMTASPSLDSAIAAVRDGAYDYVVKPFQKDDLRSVIRRCGELRSAKRELAVERQLRGELEAAYQQLKQMEKLKEGFIGRCSHELRTPLAQVLGALQVMEKSTDPAVIAERMKAAKDGGDRLREAIEDIVTFADLQGSGLELEQAPVTVEAMLLDIVEQAKPEGATRKIEVTTRFEPDLKPVRADPALLERALRHLILNAIRFNKPSGKVEVSAAKEGAFIVVAVKDTGEGVPADQKETIFDAFYQIAAFMSRRVRGLGLGLALVKRIAEAHGGTIAVDSVEGEGSTFSLRLPASS